VSTFIETTCDGKCPETVPWKGISQEIKSQNGCHVIFSCLNDLKTGWRDLASGASDLMIRKSTPVSQAHHSIKHLTRGLCFT
jgi:hypothetical protein